LRDLARLTAVDSIRQFLSEVIFQRGTAEAAFEALNRRNAIIIQRFDLKKQHR